MKTMKRLLSMMATLGLLCTAFTLSGCSSDDDNDDPVLVHTLYSGILSVQYQGQWYETNDAEVVFNLNDGGKTATITMLGVRFVPQMPVTIDVEIPSVQVSSSGVLSGNNIVPYALGGPYEAYKVTNLTGKVTNLKLELSLNFGEFPTKYIGSFNPDKLF